jgi:hypothetical protein
MKKPFTGMPFSPGQWHSLNHVDISWLTMVHRLMHPRPMDKTFAPSLTWWSLD